jgi:potassium efflux system protein
MQYGHWRYVSLVGALFLLGQCCASVLPATETNPNSEKAQSRLPTDTEPSPTSGRSESEPASGPASSQHLTTEGAPGAVGREESGATITVEEVQARMSSIEASTEIAEPLRSQVLEVYRDVLEQISSAQTWSAKIVEYQKGQAEAPADLEAVQQELDVVTNAPAVRLHLAESTTLDDLAQEISAADGELRQKQAVADKLDAQAQNRADRSQAIPGLRAAANQQLESLSAESAGVAEARVPSQLALAHRCLLLARRAAIEQEIRAYQEEFAFYRARSAVLAAKRSKARREVDQAQALIDVLRAAANELRAADVIKQKQRAEEKLKNAPWEIQRQLAINPKLASERETISAELRELPAKHEKLRVDDDRIGNRLGRLRKRVEQDSESDVLGPLMRSARLELNKLRDAEREARELRKKYAQVQSRLSEVRDHLVQLTDVDSRKRILLATLHQADPQLDLTSLEPKTREMLETRRDLLEGLKTDYETYSTELLQLMDAQGRIVSKVRAARELVDRYSLWLPSTGPIFKASLPKDREGLARHAAALPRLLIPPEREQRIYTLITYALALVVLLGWLALTPSLRSRLRDASLRVAKVQTDSFRLTLLALLYTFLLAACWPGLMWFAAWRLEAAADANDVAAYETAHTLGSALLLAGLVVFFMSLVRQICRPGGLGESHFHWNAAGLRLVRTNTAWLLAVAAPAVFIIAATEVYPDGDWRDLFGRAAFMLGNLALMLYVWRVGHPRRGAFAEWLQYHTDGWLYRTRYVLFSLLLVLPLALAAAAAIGYYYTALQLAHRLILTARLVFLVLLLHALLRRAVFVAQRRLALEQARRKRAAAAAARLAEQENAAEEAPPPIEEEQLDLISIGEQTRKLLRTVAFFVLAIGLWLSWSELLPALSFLGEIKLWAYSATEAAGQNAAGAAAEATTHVVKYITLGNVTAAALVAIATVVLAKNIPGLLEIALLQRLPLDTGGRFAITAVSRYVITVAGVIVAFGEIGVGWSKVQWLIAAMTVGLGFGLQEIFANFVSGLMLLFERPIRIGDTVTIGDISGTVSRIRIRATTITDWDRKELVIPNKEFITGKVVNWTLSDSTLRIILPIGIAYGSDTELAEQLLYKVARENEDVLPEPAPRVYFRGFGESALDFELRVFVSSVDLWLGTQHELNKAIDREFRQAGIEIAFPQRDIHVRTIQQALPLIEARNHGSDLRPPASADSSTAGHERNLDRAVGMAVPPPLDSTH